MRVTLAFCAALVSAVWTFSESPVASAGSARAAAPVDDADPAMKKVSGEFVSLQQNVLTVKDKAGMLRSFKTSSATSVTLDGKSATLNALKAGDKIDAVVAELDTATKINATRPKS